MRQLSRLEINRLNDIKTSSLIISVFSDNLENYIFPKINIDWLKNDNNEAEKSSVMFVENNDIYLIQNYNHYSNFFILLPDLKKEYLPSKDNIWKIFDELNIHDQLIWFNEWWYISDEIKLKEKITQWVNEEKSIVEIYDKTKLLTGLDYVAIKNLLTSHSSLAGSEEVKSI